jgi:pimeloyl-ACP methyl ester carboxylesterase
VPAKRNQRRDFLKTLAVGATGATMSRIVPGETVQHAMPVSVQYGGSTLPSGVRSRVVNGINGLDVHVLEAGQEEAGRPLILLLHGFPDLAYGWRKVMIPLSEAGYYVVAPDQRGFGQTTGWVNSYDTSLDDFGLLNMSRDAVALVSALGYRRVSVVVGHDAGSLVAAWCSLTRPDIFRSVAFLSVPFSGAPRFPFDVDRHDHLNHDEPQMSWKRMTGALENLNPPRKFYQDYYSGRDANQQMHNPPQGLRNFLRAYFHVKSADWSENKPFRLKGWDVDEIRRIPNYYVMDKDKTMPETVAPDMPISSQIKACKWLTESELDVYTTEYGRTGFQGGLQAYRVYSDTVQLNNLRLYSQKTIDVPSCFIGGEEDWAVYLTPGATDAMQKMACTKMTNFTLVRNAGHWIQQEQSDATSKLLIEFATLSASSS